MARFVNPFTDVGFKRIFGQEVSKDLLLDFLNVLLAGERCITDITFLDKEQLSVKEDFRTIIYDVYCLTETGEHIIVEMQNKRQRHFVDRSIYYASRSIVGQGLRGDQWDYHVDAVYGVFFMNFTHRQLPRQLRTDVILADRSTGAMLSDKMRLIYLQLPLFDKQEDECDTDFERWIYVIKNMEILERMPWMAQNQVFERLAELADVGKLNPEQQREYDRALKAYRDSLATYETSHAEGRAEGRLEGRAEGRLEGQSLLIMSMLNNGVTVEQIAQMTGMSVDEINALISSQSPMLNEPAEPYQARPQADGCQE